MIIDLLHYPSFVNQNNHKFYSTYLENFHNLL